MSNPSFVKIMALRSAALAAASFAFACSTHTLDPMPILPEAPPHPYTAVPHPEGLTIADLMALFAEKGAPAPDSQSGCDVTYRKLRERTRSFDELVRGARELVKADPVMHHWCFYSTVWTLEQKIKDAPYIEDRQREVIRAYVYLTPMARAFREEYSDTRYLRWAISRYQRLSESVFYRRVEITPHAASEIGGAEVPLQGLRPKVDQPEQGVLTKYGLMAVPAAVTQELSKVPRVQETPTATLSDSELDSTLNSGPGIPPMRSPARSEELPAQPMPDAP